MAHVLYHLLAGADGGRLTEMVLQPLGQTVFPERGTGAVYHLKQRPLSEHIEVEGIRMFRLDVSLTVVKTAVVACEGLKFFFLYPNLGFQPFLPVKEPAVQFHEDEKRKKGETDADYQQGVPVEKTVDTGQSGYE